MNPHATSVKAITKIARQINLCHTLNVAPSVEAQKPIGVVYRPKEKEGGKKKAEV